MNPLDLVERNLFLDPVIELSRARRLMASDPHGDFEVASVPEMLRDPGPPEAVGADLRGQPCLPRPALDHPERRRPHHRPIFQQVLSADRAAPEKRPLPILPQLRRFEIRVHVFLRRMVRGNHVVTSAPLVESEKGALPLRVVVRSPHRYRRAHPRETEHQDADQRPVAQADERREVDTVQEPLTSSAESTGVLPFFMTCFTPAPISPG